MDLREQVCDFGLSLYNRGFTHGSTGNLSVRLPDGNILVTPTGSSLGRLTPEDLSVITPNGELVSGPKPTKEVPIRSIAMFILTNENHQVLLYKRPPDGIWGSLYSLPESPDPRTVPQLGSLGSESNNEAIDIKQAIVMDPIRHTFSHFHLDIQPIRLAINPDKLTVGNSDEWLWYPLNQSVEVGLAAPVKRLLSQIVPQ